MEATDDGATLTGKVLGDIVDGQRKMELLEMIAEKEGVSLAQVPNGIASLTSDDSCRRRSERPPDATTLWIWGSIQR